MAVQGRALMKMISMIVKSLDNSTDLQKTIYTLGGRHEIYGVTPADYIEFSNAMCDTVETVLGKAICTPEIRDSWFKILTELSVMMQGAARMIKSEPINSVVYRKFHKTTTSWKKSAISITIDSFYIYKEEKLGKLRSSYSLSEVNGIELLSPDGEIETKTPFGFSIELSSYRQPYLFICCETRVEMNRLMEEFSWRTAAVLRVMKEDDDSESSASADKKASKSYKENK